MTLEAPLADPSKSQGLGSQADSGVRPALTHPDGKPIVNDVVITIATSNGTGSQSANLILMRTLFNMGVPVGGKNMFPSNIQGLPTGSPSAPTRTAGPAAAPGQTSSWP